MTAYRSEDEAETAGYSDASELIAEHADIPNLPEVVILSSLLGKLLYFPAFRDLPQVKAYARGVQRRLEQKRAALLRRVDERLSNRDAERGEPRG